MPRDTQHATRNTENKNNATKHARRSESAKPAAL